MDISLTDFHISHSPTDLKETLLFKKTVQNIKRNFYNSKSFALVSDTPGAGKHEILNILAREKYILIPIDENSKIENIQKSDDVSFDFDFFLNDSSFKKESIFVIEENVIKNEHLFKASINLKKHELLL